VEVEERTLLVKQQQPRCALRSPVGELLTPHHTALRHHRCNKPRRNPHPSRAVRIVTLYLYHTHTIHARQTEKSVAALEREEIIAT